jgi:hypothetical protein
MSVHVKNGTPLHQPSLCETCTNAHTERGYRESELQVFCTAHYPIHRVPFLVRECSGYVDKNRQNFYEMEKMAWILAPRGPKRKAGFIPVSKLLNEDGEIELTLEQE